MARLVVSAVRGGPAAPADVEAARTGIDVLERRAFVHRAVRIQAQLSAERPALVTEAGQKMSYRALMQRTRRLAESLRGAGVRADECVAVAVDRSADLLVALLATLEAGGAFVPISPYDPDGRIAGILERVRPAALVSDHELRAPLGSATALVPIPPDAEECGAARVDDETAPELELDHLAYVLHTSGSTGGPKGVAMSHRGLSRLIRWQAADAPAGLATLWFTPVSFDVMFQEVFSTLCTGGTLHMVAERVRQDPERLLASLVEHSIERLFLPYVALHQLARAARRSGVYPIALQHVVTAGERLVVTPTIADFFAALPDCRLDNHYGPTEAHLVTSLTLADHPTGWPELPPIGRPVGDVTLYNLDDDLTPVGPGDPGQLYVGGDGVARGYLGAPSLTAERFVPDPFPPSGGARMYATGDAVRIDPDGLVHFVGRIDDQLKVRGFRVEPAEIELALARHPHVREAAVGLRGLADGVDGLVAYVVADDPAADSAELTAHLRAELPSYMVPTRCVLLDALPLTVTGKVDRAALSSIDLPTQAVDSTVGEPLLETVRSIWERVLGHDELAPDDDFFDVGGDSLLAMWVAAELSRVLGRDVDVSLLLQDSTLEGIADALDGHAAHLSDAVRLSELVTLRPGPLQRPLFVAHALGGEVMPYRALARAMLSPLRVLGLRWRPDIDAAAAATSVEAMAAAHLEQLLALQPAGPYLLAGWSFGGVLAFELARQLEARGEPVEFLGLLDANPAHDPITGLRVEETLYDALISDALERIEAEPGARSGGLTHPFDEPGWQGLLGSAVAADVPARHLRRNLTIAGASMAALSRYRPEAYHGAIDLFQPAATSPAIRSSLAAELRNLTTGPVRVHQTPGDHNSMLRPPLAEATAQALDDALESIRKASDRGS